jgi:hypothetical protein
MLFPLLFNRFIMNVCANYWRIWSAYRHFALVTR